MTLVEDLPMDRAATEALASLAFVTALLGRPAEAIALAERGLILARDHGWPTRGSLPERPWRGAAAAGRPRGLQRLHASAGSRLEAGLGHESAMAYHNLAELQLQGVGPESSLEMNERGLDLAERRGLTLAADWLRANRVQVCFEAGRWDEALALADAGAGRRSAFGARPAGHDVCGVVGADPPVARRPRPRDPADGHVPAACPPARGDPADGAGADRRGLIETASGRADRGAATPRSTAS